MVAPALVVERGEQEAVELEEVAGAVAAAAALFLPGIAGIAAAVAGRAAAASFCPRPASSACSAPRGGGSGFPDERRRQRPPLAHEAEERPLRRHPGAELPRAHRRERRLPLCRCASRGGRPVAGASPGVLLVQLPLQHGRRELPPTLFFFFFLCGSRPTKREGGEENEF